MPERKLRVGLIGVGNIAQGEHLPAWQRIPQAQVIAAADVSVSALKQVSERFGIQKTYYDWQEMLKEVPLDVVDICTPNQWHPIIAREALSRGIHVLCEKPLATSSAAVLELKQLAEKNKRIIMTAHHLRFRPSTIALQHTMKHGRIGNIYYLRAQWLRRRMLPPSPTFIHRELSGGGAIWDIGVHVLDLAYYLLGCPRPLSVSAQIDCYLANRPDLGSIWGDWDRQKMDVDDFAIGWIRFENGTSLCLETSWLAFQPDAEIVRLQGYGTQGGFLWPEGIICGETEQIPWTTYIGCESDKLAYINEVKAFVEAILENKPSPVPLEQTHTVIRILELFEKSSREKREIRFPERD